MEDQRSDSGDLSDEAEATAESAAAAAESPKRHRMPRGKARRAVAKAEAKPDTDEADVATTDAVETDVIETDAAAEQPVEAAASTIDDDAQSEAAPNEPGDDETPEGAALQPVKPAGPRTKQVVVAAAAVLVAGGAFAGAALFPYVNDRAIAHNKTEIARIAANTITTLWTYTPDDMDQLAQRSSKYLGGDFQVQFSKYIDAIAPTNKQAQVTNKTDVVGAAVESLNGPDATAIVYTNRTATSPLSKNIPSMLYTSYRLTMHRQDQEWRVTGMSTITNLDLTPKF